MTLNLELKVETTHTITEEGCLLDLAKVQALVTMVEARTGIVAQGCVRAQRFQAQLPSGPCLGSSSQGRPSPQSSLRNLRDELLWFEDRHDLDRRAIPEGKCVDEPVCHDHHLQRTERLECN